MRSTGDFPQTLRPIVYGVQNFHRNFRILWRHLQTHLRNVFCFTKYIWSCNRGRK